MEQNFIHGLALIRLSGTETLEEDRIKVIRGGGGGGTKKYIHAREKQLKLTKKNHAASIIN